VSDAADITSVYYDDPGGWKGARELLRRGWGWRPGWRLPAHVQAQFPALQPAPPGRVWARKSTPHRPAFACLQPACPPTTTGCDGRTWPRSYACAGGWRAALHPAQPRERGSSTALGALPRRDSLLQPPIACHPVVPTLQVWRAQLCPAAAHLCGAEGAPRTVCWGEEVRREGERGPRAGLCCCWGARVGWVASA
jgi:hypothetical protein